MLSARISLIAGLGLILLAALVLTAVGGCAGANAIPLPTGMVQNVAPMPTAAELASATSTDVPAPAPVTATLPTIGSDFQTTDGSRTPTIDPAGKGASPTPEGKSTLAARATLERFMQARIDRDEPGVLDLLTEQLQAKVMRGLPVDVPLTQVSNPCWYRYLVLTFNEASAAQAQARVRVYEHQWPGDNAGSLPRSWEQKIGLTETTAGWRVDELGEAENEHQEPNEPHGPTLSACTAWRQTPANANPTLTPP